MVTQHSNHHHVKGEDCHFLKDDIKTQLVITEKDDCPVCDFKFASFLKTDIFTFKFYSPYKESPYSFSIKEATSFFCGSLFCLRGPPQFV